MRRACSLLVVAFLLPAACSAGSDASDGTTSKPNDLNQSADPTVGTFSAKAGKAVCKPTAEKCSGGQDEDCDGLIDCQDPDCSGVGSCPVCGQVDHPEAAPLALPDGNDGKGVPYESKLKFTGFGAGKTLTNASDFVNVCVTMEHSWLRDLEIKLISPDNKEVILNDFRGRDGGEIHLGKPNTDDDAAHPIPGTGAQYCWAADAPNPAMLDSKEAKEASDLDSDTVVTLPPGTYKPSGTIDSLVGSTLDGNWTIRVTDKWSEDNGFIFGWSISFKPTLVADCSAPLVDTNVK